MNNLKYFWIKLSHDNGTTYLKTACESMEVAIKNTMLVENCPQSAIEIKEVPKDLYSMTPRYQFNRL